MFPFHLFVSTIFKPSLESWAPFVNPPRTLSTSNQTAGHQIHRLDRSMKDSYSRFRGLKTIISEFRAFRGHQRDSFRHVDFFSGDRSSKAINFKRKAMSKLNELIEKESSAPSVPISTPKPPPDKSLCEFITKQTVEIQFY